MRTRINNITFTPDTRSINTGITDLTIDDIRLFINESQMKVICSSMQKDNIVSINSGVVTYKDTFPVLAVGDHITFEIDRGDDVAKEANATANKNEILTKIENTQPDLSTVAKQGSNSNTSLTVVDEKIDDFYDTFDADIALQLQGIIGVTEGSVSGTSQTAAKVEELRTLQESYDELMNNIQSIANSWTAMVEKRNTLDGYELIDPYVAESTTSILVYRGYIKSIRDESVTILPKKSSMGGTWANLSSVDFPNVITLYGQTFSENPSLKYVNMPSLVTCNSYEFASTSIEEIELPSLKTMGFGMFQSGHILKRIVIPKVITFQDRVIECPQLIDIVIGENFTTNQSFSSWYPTEALSSSNSSLVEPDESFANNLEKLLYNIREHITANLPDRTGLSALTITFSAAVKTAILADVDTANAFADKNWTVS